MKYNPERSLITQSGTMWLAAWLHRTAFGRKVADELVAKKGLTPPLADTDEWETTRMEMTRSRGSGVGLGWALLSSD